MKSNLKSGWVVSFALAVGMSAVWLLTPRAAQADTCDPATECTYASQCYSDGACNPAGQECVVGDNGAKWMSVKDSQQFCSIT